MAELDGMVALVAGGTSGIGHATAGLLLSRGASVALCGVEDGQVQAVGQRFRAEYGAAAVLATTVDVTREDEVRRWIGQAAGFFGALDAVVTAVGIQTYGSVAGSESVEFERTMDVNVKGAYLVIKHAVPELRRRGGGAVVAVSSVQAFASQDGVAAYSASKGALNALVRSVAVDEAAHGIRANAVCPASVDTPMLRASARRFGDGTDAGEQQLLDQWGAMHPLGRIARPQEVAEVIAFLAGERASFVTGVSLPVDGGLLCRLAVALPG